MKKLILCVLAFGILGCGDSTSTDSSKYLQLVEAYDALSDENLKDKDKALSHLPANIIEDAKALIERQYYENSQAIQLISPKELSSKLDSFVIISTLPRGIYNLGLIPGAKHFEFALSPSLNDDGSEWNWAADALGRSQEDFISLLGENKNANIVFYDSGDDILAPMGSAQVGAMWAKHLGYNVYRLVGGFGAWKDSGLKVSTEAPHCCKM